MFASINFNAGRQIEREFRIRAEIHHSCYIEQSQNGLSFAQSQLRCLGMSDNDEVSASAVPEVYYDIIARIIPGTLALWIYGWTDVEKGFDFAKLSIGLVLSYTIGLTLNMIVNAVAQPLWKAFQKRAEWIRNRTKNRRDDGELWLWIRKLPLRDRNLYTKMMAEKALFSSLATISLSAAVIPPRSAQLHISRWWAPLAFSICLAFRFRVNTWLSWHMRKSR